MIPKKIHYTWFSGEPYPGKVKDCIESWKVLMPGYELILWDTNRIKNINSDFLQEAIRVGKWAFAADFIRLWALYHEGGIYLDTDVLCYKPFDCLLTNECFIGKENSLHIIKGRHTEQYLTSHCMGAIPAHPYIKDCLDYYDGRHFILSSNENLPQVLRYDMTLLPFIQSEIAKLYGYNPFPSADRMQHLDRGLSVYPSECFDNVKLSADAYCKHLALGSWRPKRLSEEKITFSYKIKWRIRRVVEVVLGYFGYIMIKQR